MTIRRRSFIASGSIAVTGFRISPSWASTDYPTKPIRLIVPYAPGGGSTPITRLIVDRLTARLNATFIVDYKPGATGNIGADFVAKSPSDGYTMLFGNGNIVQNLTVNKLPYDPFKDLVPIGLIGIGQHALVVKASLPVSTVPEFIELASKSQFSFGSFGVGGSAHLYGSQLNEMAGGKMVHAQYKGESQIIADMVRGDVTCCFLTMMVARQFESQGLLKMLGIDGTQRDPLSPAVPTFAEQGVKGFETVGWYGLFFPAGVDPEIVNKVSVELANTLAEPEIGKGLAFNGVVATPSTSKELSERMHSDFDLWNAIVKRNHIQPV